MNSFDELNWLKEEGSKCARHIETVPPLSLFFNKASSRHFSPFWTLSRRILNAKSPYAALSRQCFPRIAQQSWYWSIERGWLDTIASRRSVERDQSARYRTGLKKKIIRIKLKIWHKNIELICTNLFTPKYPLLSNIVNSRINQKNQFQFGGPRLNK